MIPTIPPEVMAEATMVARKAFRWRARALEREWKAGYPGGGSIDQISADHDLDYGEAYYFAEAAANIVFERAGILGLKDAVLWDDDRIDLDPWELECQPAS